ncbi:MAG: Gfo/Idh/MocA family oxidoreductase [Acidimicrobiia bacterium]|nr:MAG: Gfo/Idh/MocA family oxidoreductase [Acidimicrobiia bacterium]
MVENVGIVIAGAGFAASFHLESYAKVYGEEFTVLGVYHPDGSKAAALATRFNVPNVFTDFDQVLTRSDVDVVDLCVPNRLHAELAIRTAQAGKHIFCEKPLTGYEGPPDAESTGWTADGFPREQMLEAAHSSALEVADAVGKAGVTLCYAENWVYAPSVQKARRLMAASEGTIMRIVGEESHSGSHADYARQWRNAGGGSLLRLAVHPLGAAMYLKYDEGQRKNQRGIRPAFVTAEVGNLMKIEAHENNPSPWLKFDAEDVEDFGTMVVTFDDGSVAQLSATDTSLGGMVSQMTVHGSHAVVHADMTLSTAVQAYTPDPDGFRGEYLTEKLETRAGWSTPQPDEHWSLGYQEQFRDFIGSVSLGREPRSGIRLALDTVSVLYGAYLSAAEGRRIDLRPYLSGS